MRETWKDVPGYEELYQVSDLGRVKGPRGWILKPANSSNGYVQVILCKDGKHKIILVHRLVCLAFYGPYPEGKETNHKNGKRADNRLVNLEIVTRSENHRHSYQYLGHRVTKMKGTTNYQTHLSEDDVRKIRAMRSAGVSSLAVAEHFSISKGAVKHIFKRRSWKHVE